MKALLKFKADYQTKLQSMSMSIFRLPKPHPLLVSNLKSPEESTRFMTTFIQHPVGFGMVAFTAAFYAMGTMRPIIPQLNEIMSALVVGGSLLLYLFVAPWPATRFVRFALARNIPFAVSYVLFVSFACWCDVFVYYFIGVDGHTLDQIPIRCLRRTVYTTAIHIPYFILAEQRIRTGLGKSPDLIALFKPVNIQAFHGTPSSLLDNTLKGNLISLRASNQYVVVQSDEGEDLLRLTLKEAIDLLPPDAGLRIHRSWWVSAQELKEAQVTNGSTTLQTSQGRKYPIGKTRLSDIRRAI